MTSWMLVADGCWGRPVNSGEEMEPDGDGSWETPILERSDNFRFIFIINAIKRAKHWQYILMHLWKFKKSI